MMRGDPILVHPQPGADEQHGRARGAEEVGQDRADAQEHDVGPRRGLAPHDDVNAPRDHVKRADQRDEADVLVRDLRHAVLGAQPHQVIHQRQAAQPQRHFRIMLGPPSRCQQRGQGNDAQQRHEGADHPRIRLNQVFCHARSLETRGEHGQTESNRTQARRAHRTVWAGEGPGSVPAVVPGTQCRRQAAALPIAKPRPERRLARLADRRAATSACAR